MTINNFKFLKRLITLAFIVGVLPFVFSASAYASEEPSAISSQPSESKWLDDYRKPVKLKYNAQARIQAAYLWRGLYCGAFNTQFSANVGYGGLYLDMWWNIGTEDWTFTKFEPEVDFTLGFSRWGLDIYALYIHNFKHGFFDLAYYESGRNSLEVGVRYTVSSKLPLGFLWATRFTDSDSYIQDGDTVHAYSSYAEISYTQNLPKGWSIYGAVGITPWRSLYSYYQRGFAVCNAEVRVRKDWEVTPHCGLMMQGQLSINPSALAADRSTATWNPSYPFNQSVNANLTFGVYLIQ